MFRSHPQNFTPSYIERLNISIRLNKFVRGLLTDTVISFFISVRTPHAILYIILDMHAKTLHPRLNTPHPPCIDPFHKTVTASCSGTVQVIPSRTTRYRCFILQHNLPKPTSCKLGLLYSHRSRQTAYHSAVP